MHTKEYVERRGRAEPPSGRLSGTVRAYVGAGDRTGVELEVEESDMPSVAVGDVVTIGMSAPRDANLLLRDMRAGNDFAGHGPVPVGATATFEECEDLGDGRVDAAAYALEGLEPRESAGP